MEKITYGAPRLVDWVAQIKTGAATVRVHFAGGALTSYGVTPAEYTTSNPFIQKVIENSNYFKEGRIIVMRRAEIEGPKKPASKVKTSTHAVAQSLPTPVDMPKVEAPVENTSAKAATHEPKENLAAAEAGDSAPVEPSANAEADSEAEAEEQTNEDLTKVGVTCLPDAQAYLQENFNIASYKIRSCEAAQRAAAEHGVQFTGGKFDTLNAIGNVGNDVADMAE